jgi:hypothetical protein
MDPNFYFSDVGFKLAILLYGFVEMLLEKLSLLIFGTVKSGSLPFKFNEKFS